MKKGAPVRYTTSVTSPESNTTSATNPESSVPPSKYFGSVTENYSVNKTVANSTDITQKGILFSFKTFDFYKLMKSFIFLLSKVNY